MIAISITEYKESIPADILEKARPLAVRECDEESKGRYVAYVDEGNTSYDVMLAIDTKGAVTAHSCDCPAGPVTFCRHRAALLLHIAEGRKISVSIPRKTGAKKTTKKKAEPWEVLLEEAGIDDLRKWLAITLPRHKELALAFVNHFTAQQREYTPEEVMALTNEAVKAVLGKRRKVERRDLMAILKLWDELHQPVADRYKAAVTDAAGFAGFHAVIESCFTIYYHYGISGGDIPAYIERMLDPVRPLLITLQTDAAWDIATGYFVDHAFQGQRNAWNIPYLRHLAALIRDEATGRRADALLHRLAGYYQRQLDREAYNEKTANPILFYLLKDRGMMLQYSMLIKPAHWDNAFNEALIRELINLGDYRRAIDICEQQVKGNKRDEYDVVYLNLLKKIYMLQGDESGQIAVMARLLPMSFNFSDYQYIYNLLPDEEARKDLRKRIYSKARHSGNKAAMRFCIEVLLSENNPVKAIDLIDGEMPYELLAGYIQVLVAANKNILLKKLLSRNENYSWGIYNPETEADESLKSIYLAMRPHFTHTELSAALLNYRARQSKYGMMNGFVRLLIQELRDEENAEAG